MKTAEHDPYTRLFVQCEEIQAKYLALRTKYQELAKLAYREHDDCDDPFYSCMKAPGMMYAEGTEIECTCGADAHNALVDAFVKEG